jgi:hypothetical protein
LIGEELYGASAYLTREPIQMGSLYAQDRAKLIFFCLIIAGVLIATWRSFATASWGSDPLGLPDLISLIKKEIW